MGAGGRTPSDLPLVALTQGEIERLEGRHRALEDILPLSPLQEGLLFHALYDAQGPDLYTVQLELELEGALDGSAAAGLGAGGGGPACEPAGGVPARAAEPSGAGDRAAGRRAVAAARPVGARA